MAVAPPPPSPLERGQLPAQVMHFARLLRGAGLPIGSDRVQAALAALQVAGLASEADFHAVLGACLLDRNEHRPLFDQAISLFWHDPDQAAAADGLPALPINGRAVADWSGGTRITQSLHAFNQRWARRVLSGRATVLLISDGLEAGDTQALGFEMERLHKSCRRLIWLNPLLRYAQFEPKAGGIRAMLQQVDQFLPAHNLRSLADLVGVLGDLRQPHTTLRPERQRQR